MRNITLSTAFVFGISCFAPLGTVLAQEALSSCDPVTGLTPSGAQCVTLTPVDPTRYQTQIDGEGASGYRPVDVDELAETYECNRSDRREGYSGGGTILIEDCGAPLALDPATFKDFVGYAGNAPPAPVYAAPPPPPAPVYVAPPPPAPVYAAAPALPAPAVYAPLTLASAGLGNAGLIAAGLGAAALAGIALVAFNDDDDDDDTSTATTN